MSTKSNIEVGEPNYFMTKSKFGYKNQAHDFEYATFEWLLKRGLRSREANPNAHRETVLDNISVHVWDVVHYLPDQEVSIFLRALERHAE